MDNKKLIIIVIALLIIWGSLIYVGVNYAEELRNHPCQVCANKMGEEINCITKTYPPKQETFIPNEK